MADLYVEFGDVLCGDLFSIFGRRLRGHHFARNKAVLLQFRTWLNLQDFVGALCFLSNITDCILSY